MAKPPLEQISAAMSSNMTRIIDVFKQWDEDASGTISKKEFASALFHLGLRIEQAQVTAPSRRKLGCSDRSRPHRASTQGGGCGPAGGAPRICQQIHFWHAADPLLARRRYTFGTPQIHFWRLSTARPFPHGLPTVTSVTSINRDIRYIRSLMDRPTPPPQVD